MLKILSIKVISVALFLLLSLYFTHIHAQENSISKFTLSGYGTLSYTVDDRSDMALMRDFSQRPDDGYKTGGTWKLDSRLALQAHYRFSPTVDFIIQGVLRDQVEQSVANSMELTYMAWRPNSRLNIRAGRLGYDAFMMSDTRNLGYAYMWVRPPPEFYAWIPIFSVDGVDISYTTNVGEWQLRFKTQAGTSHTDVPIGKEDTYYVEAHDLWNLSFQGEKGPWRLKAAFTKMQLMNDIQSFKPLQEGLEQISSSTMGMFPKISSEASFLRDEISFKNMDITYFTLGAAYDDGTWVGQVELSKSDMSTNLMQYGYMGYIGVGHRFHDWTPYGVFSFARPTYDVYEQQSDWGAIGMGGVQGQAVQIYNGTRTDQETYSLGLRWDFCNQAAVKLQWDNSYVKPYYGLWWRKISTSTQSSHINQCTFSLEFVF